MESDEFCCEVVNNRFIIKARVITKQQLVEANRLNGNFFLGFTRLIQNINQMIKREKPHYVVIDWLDISPVHPRFALLEQVVKLLQRDGRPEILHCGMAGNIRRTLIQHGLLQPETEDN